MRMFGTFKGPQSRVQPTNLAAMGDGAEEAAGPGPQRTFKPHCEVCTLSPRHFKKENNNDLICIS